MRTYERTHPWLTFRIDLRHAQPRLWMNLGEAASKCEHIAGVPLRRVSTHADPARFEWDEVTKVAHYYLSVDALTQPMQVCEDQAPYGGKRNEIV